MAILSIISKSRVFSLIILILSLGTQDVLNSIASDCLVDGGYCLNAAEVFWTPGDRDEVLTKTDVIIDFPELVDL